MNNTVDPAKLKKAKFASSCFMGLGQILFLKQYVRGFLYALVEVIMICCFIFGTKRVIPANTQEERYMKGLPEYSEMVEYLEEKEYKDLDSLIDARRKAVSDFFAKKAASKISEFKYSVAEASVEQLALEELGEDADIKAIKKFKADYLATANKNKIYVEDESDGQTWQEYFADFDFTDDDSLDEAVMEFEDAFYTLLSDNEEYVGLAYDKLAGEYEASVDGLNKIIEKHNNKLSKAMASIAYNEYNEQAKEFFVDFDLQEEKQRVKQEKADKLAVIEQEYTTKKSEIENREVVKVLQENSTEHYVIPATEDASLETEVLASSELEVYTEANRFDDLEKLAKEREEKVNEINRSYSYNVKERVLSENGIENEFDKNFDNCHECIKAAKAGKRTVRHSDVFFGSPIVSAVTGLITLGVDQPTEVMNYKDHSINMMIDGIFALIFVALFIVLYIMNVQSAGKAAKKIEKNNKFPTMREAKDDMSQNSFASIGIAPSIVMIAVFSIIPLVFSALVAFTNYQSPDHIPPKNLVSWVGFENFVTMFSTSSGVSGGGAFAAAFANSAIWTFVWAVFATLTCFFVGFFYAVVLQDKKIKFPAFYRTIYILPYAIPTMLSLFIWANLLNGQMGPINHTLRLLGVIDAQGDTPVMFSWLSNPWVAKFALIFVNIWIGFPYSMILTTSSMTAISASLYEAATIDGANKWHQFKNITFPLVMFQLKPILIMQFASNINNFGAVFFLTGGGPNLPQTGLTTSTSCGATDLLISWIYKLTMNTPMRYNLASVLSLLVFAVLVPFALYSFTRTKSFKEGEV